MKPQKLKDLLRTTIRDNPKASQKEIRNLCAEVCRSDARLQVALFEYWFTNSYRDFTVVQYEENNIAVLSASRRHGVEDRSARASAVNDLKERLKSCLMDHELSDGTLLRDANFGQCAREGGWLLTISKQGRANEIVGKKLTEAELGNLRRRFYGKMGRDKAFA